MITASVLKGLNEGHDILHLFAKDLKIKIEKGEWKV